MYALGVDVGTAQITTCSIGIDPPLADDAGSVPDFYRGVESVSAAAFVDPNGAVVTGRSAELLGSELPENLIRDYLRRVGDAVDIVIGDRCIGAETILAAVIGHAVRGATQRWGCPPVRVCVTHPAQWGSYRIGVLAQALTTVLPAAGTPEVLLVANAVAAARSAAPELGEGQALAVLDVGAGNATAAVVTRTDGVLRLAGPPRVADDVGGTVFDDALLAHVCAGAGVGALDRSVPGLGGAVRTVRQHCTAVKEALSEDTAAVVPIELPGCSTRIRVVRSEFEDLIAPAVTECVEVLREVLASSDTSGIAGGTVGGVLLTGGSSRLPLMVQTVSTTTGLPITVADRPESAAAEGAARLAVEGAPVLAGAGSDQEDPAGHDTAGGRTEDPAEARKDAPTPPDDRDPEQRGSSDDVAAQGTARAGHRSTTTPSPADASAGTRPPTAHRRARKRALAATLLAAGLFAASAFAAPRLLQSDGARDTLPPAIGTGTHLAGPPAGDQPAAAAAALVGPADVPAHRGGAAG